METRHSLLHQICLNSPIKRHNTHNSISPRKIRVEHWNPLPLQPHQQTAPWEKPPPFPSEALKATSWHPLQGHVRAHARVTPAAGVSGAAVHLFADRSLCRAGFPILHDYLFVTAGEWWHSAWSPDTFTVTYLSLWIHPVCQAGA